MTEESFDYKYSKYEELSQEQRDFLIEKAKIKCDEFRQNMANFSASNDWKSQFEYFAVAFWATLDVTDIIEKDCPQLLSKLLVYRALHMEFSQMINQFLGLMYINQLDK